MTALRKTRTCADCPKAINVASVRCKSCAGKAKYRDPAAREAMSKAKRKALTDPAKRARVVAAAQHNLREWHRTTDRDWSAWHRANRIAMLSWLPADRRADYDALRLKVGAKEARRILEAEIPSTVEHARRQIANFNIAQRLRRERERQQEY